MKNAIPPPKRPAWSRALRAALGLLSLRRRLRHRRRRPRPAAQIRRPALRVHRHGHLGLDELDAALRPQRRGQRRRSLRRRLHHHLPDGQRDLRAGLPRPRAVSNTTRPSRPKPDLNAPELQPIIVDDSDTARFTATIGLDLLYSGTNDHQHQLRLQDAASTPTAPPSIPLAISAPTRPGTATNDPSTDASHVAKTSSKAIFKWTTELPAPGLYHVYSYWYIRRDRTTTTTPT